MLFATDQIVGINLFWMLCTNDKIDSMRSITAFVHKCLYFIICY